MTKSIDQFAETAGQVCAWLKSPPEGAEQQLHELRILLADLHAAVLRLPDEFDDDAPDSKRRTQKEWESLYDDLQELPFNHYREMYDPFTEDDPVVGSLADDLADIYFDLQDGLEMYRAGHPIGAAWQWRFLFWHHWGEHLTGAQRAIHWWFARCEQNA